MTAQDLTREQLIEFFSRPGINKNGICEEAGVSRPTVNYVLAGGRMIRNQWKAVQFTDSMKEKLFPVLTRYGFLQQ